MRVYDGKPLVRIGADLAALAWLHLGFGAVGFAVYVAGSPRLISVCAYMVGGLFFLVIGWVALRQLPRLAQQAVAMPPGADREDRGRFWRAEAPKLVPLGVVGLVLLVFAPGILSWYVGLGSAALRWAMWVGKYERETGAPLFRERGRVSGRRPPLYVDTPLHGTSPAAR